jgi:sarcosine oxidase subunit beta
MATLEDYARKASAHGLELELIGHNELRHRFGWIGGAAVAGGSWCSGDGHANPRLVATAFASAARRAGATVMENTPVTGVSRLAEGFLVEAGDGVTLHAVSLVNSAGAWSDTFAAAFGETVPLLRIYPSMTPPVIAVNVGMEGKGIYARQVARGNCIIGGERGLPLPDVDFSRPQSNNVLAVMNRAAELFPALRHAQAIRFWSGTEGAMPDSNPVIGPSATTPGLIHAFGFSGAGFQIAPGVGEVVAELIVDGRTRTPIDAFAITRFSGTSASTGRQTQ